MNQYHVYEMCGGRRVASTEDRRAALWVAGYQRVSDEAPTVVVFGPTPAPETVGDVSELTSGPWGLVAKIYRVEGESP